MSSESAIRLENISKLYRLGEIGTGTLSHDLNRWWARVRGKEDPFAKIGTLNDRTAKGGDYAWALKDISFDVKQGQVLGVIGKNGAGKSTLLKILSRVTTPSTGNIYVKGRIASLLEVGTGFHPELTGKENIYLNGAILGMTKAEIKRKFDEIVDFAGVAKYIGTPVKRYSSGMYVRLAFAVAAHLESEILIVDEVLAVGDAEFQAKCIGKMGEVSSKEGRTVLFVSHNMSSIKRLCEECVLLQNGYVEMKGKTDAIIAKYIEGTNSFTNGEIGRDTYRPYSTGQAFFDVLQLRNEDGDITNQFYYKEKISARIVLSVEQDLTESMLLSILISTRESEPIVFNEHHLPRLAKGKYEIDVWFDTSFMPGNYSVLPTLSLEKGKTLDWVERAADFTVDKISKDKSSDYVWNDIHGHVYDKSRFEIKNLG
jgi:lipopolysaccharide transport system ATP-binding protein